MAQYIDKAAVVAEIERLKRNTFTNFDEGVNAAAQILLDFLDALEMKEVDLNNGIQLTWEDVRELYIIFAEVDAEIELCKTDIKTETLGYYQEVLKRFKAKRK